MAAPHVTGAVALYKAKYPNARGPDIKNALMTSAVATKSLSRKCVTNGRLDVHKMLQIAPLG